MRSAILEQMKTGITVEELRSSLDGTEVLDATLAASSDLRARPYLLHRIDGWTDGPPNSNIVVVIAGRDPNRPVWRRFALKKTGPWQIAVDAFPTPFNNADAPLAPGIPPGASRRVD